MNPACQVELIKNGKTVGVMAHIESHASGGDPSFENLILLCRNCHEIVDQRPNRDSKACMRLWKKNRNCEIQQRFASQLQSYEELSEVIRPMLNRNRQIFNSYGPNNGTPNNSRQHDLWKTFEHEIVCNNRRLDLILSANVKLLHPGNQEIINDFLAHSREFETTRGGNTQPRVHLFPKELLSAFGLAEAPSDVPSNLSALQNFISWLIRKRRFVSLNLDDDPSLTYRNNGKCKQLRLRDRPQVQQIYWSGRFYEPRTTDVRVENVIFLARWLQRNKIRYEFSEIANNLTTLTLNGKHVLRLCYKYLLSVSDVNEMTLNTGDMVVNLHNWNNAPISEKAHEYAAQLGVRLYSQNDFFIYVHKKLK